MHNKETWDEKLDKSSNKDKLYTYNSVTKDTEKTQVKKMILSGLLIVDFIFITCALLEEISVYIIVLSVVLLSMLCVYVRLSSIKSEKKELFQKVEKYLSTILMIIVLMGSIIAYAAVFNVLVLHKPGHSEDYGYGILAVATLLFPFYVDVFTYPFIFIFFDKKITKIVLWIKLACILFIILSFMFSF